MKLTKSQLRQIVKEEYEKAISFYEDGIEKMQLDESRDEVLYYSLEIINVFSIESEFTKQ